MSDAIAGLRNIGNSVINGIDTTFKETAAFWTGKKPKNVTPLDEAAVFGVASTWPVWMIMSQIVCTPDGHITPEEDILLVEDNKADGFDSAYKSDIQTIDVPPPKDLFQSPSDLYLRNDLNIEDASLSVDVGAEIESSVADTYLFYRVWR